MDIITPILSVVSFLCSCSGNNRCCYLWDLKENKDTLNTAMEELKDARDDVKIRVDKEENNPNKPMKRTREVDGWLQRVQTIEGEVCEILEKVDQEIEGRCLGGYCPKSCWSANKIGKLVIQKLSIVNDLRSKRSFRDVAYKLPPPLVQIEPVDLPVGMESTFQKVLKSIVEDDAIRIMGLYGQGGVGKTTLLKQINNEFLKSTTTTHGFDVVILVVVSKKINIDAIQEEIGNRLGLPWPNNNKLNICRVLTTMNFLLLLDDIWERVDLQSIGIPPPENNQSKVIFTTRSETVCGAMDADKKIRVECLPWNEAWTLFQKKVGNETLNSHPKVSELAELVARECGGLPLALITIGRAMSSKKTLQEWNHAIATLGRSASKFPGMCDKVLTLLKLSYDDIQNETIKSCFLYCALYPEDHSICITKLIDYWIGEGILNEFDHIHEARNHGYDIIGNLKGACLLESGRDEETEVKMHDTIRDLALWIAKECGGIERNKMLIIGESNRMSERSWYNAERILLRPLGGRGKVDVYLSPPNSPNLLTLIYDSCVALRVPDSFFQFMPLLRVLDLAHSNMETFPTSITELLELEHLNLSWTYIDVLPGELRKLVKLKYLDLSHMIRLEKITSGVISSLLELRVLNIQDCSTGVSSKYGFPGEVWDIEEVYQLKHLNDLRITIKTQTTLNKFLSLSYQNLQMCTTHLHLQVYYRVFSLSSLTSSTFVLGEDNIKSLGKLELLSNLETLLIQSLPMNMEWENHLKAQQHLRFFQNLSQITISGCHALKDLTWVVHVENLRRLDVETCEGIEEIIVGGKISKMMNNDIFKSLKILKISYLPKLKSICSHALVFPSLVSMYVFKCPKLKKLPFDSRSNVNNTLQVIEGQREWWNELEWEDHDIVKSKFSSLY